MNNMNSVIRQHMKWYAAALLEKLLKKYYIDKDYHVKPFHVSVTYENEIYTVKNIFTIEGEHKKREKLEFAQISFSIQDSSIYDKIEFNVMAVEIRSRSNQFGWWRSGFDTNSGGMIVLPRIV